MSSFPHFYQSMSEFFYSGLFAGRQLLFAFRHRDTWLYFPGFLSASEPRADAIRIPREDYYMFDGQPFIGDSPFNEYSLSVFRASDALIPYDCFVFHGAAFLWHERAWILTGVSGTGKSTQLRHWMSLYGDEIWVMNGDKPILSRDAYGCFSVHPSPWKGKERWGDDTFSAPLGGIVLLQQGKDNSISLLSPARAARPLFMNLFSAFETAEQLRALCRLEEELITTTPLWKLVNRGDEASAVLTHETLLSEGVLVE